ncbi:fungal-specific transcription factor domain-containing protein [Amylocystis lapponica]|nr:fungal-specific transcription factor domain-containing protein [Amylocystis lapponica]
MSSVLYPPQFPPSDDEHEPGPSTTVKRGSRGPQCLSYLVLIPPHPQGDRCKNCVAAETRAFYFAEYLQRRVDLYLPAQACTYHGPSFKRGPPKGYIHAIEQRWHQVESLLGTIMASPRAESIISDLRTDPFARNILDRVDAGPYGRTGRLQPATNETLYATIMSAHNRSTNEDRRARRQSRVTREIVSTEGRPNLNGYTYQRMAGSAISPFGWRPSIYISDTYVFSCFSIYQFLPEPSRRTRRRIDAYSPGDQWTSHAASEESRSHDDDDEIGDAAGSFGHLSLDEKRELHYYGPASGLPLLARSDRAEMEPRPGAHGLWIFPKMKEESVTPPLSEQFEGGPDDDPHLLLVPVDMQARLVELYFTYVHPFFPVLHKQHFMSEFNRRIGRDVPQSVPVDMPLSPQREPMQRVCNLLLLAMFSVAERYANESPPISGADLWNTGAAYASDARKILMNMYQNSRPSTCQALLLLGYREFGLGTTEQGWLYSGLALRMAVDLGMNRNADKWRENSGELFSNDDKQTRKQIWWSCCTTDKLSSMWLGRPVMFKANDFTTPRPDVERDDKEEFWPPFPVGALGPDFTPVPSRVLSTFREACSLSAIIIEIMDRIYSVSPLPERERRSVLESLEARLHRWMIGLPDHLRFSTNSLATPLPHILMLHLEYYAAMLLLHRAFIPQWDDSIVTVYDEKYGLDRSPPFLSIYLQSAGIMHVITLKRRPQNAQASLGLRQCMTALEHVESDTPPALFISARRPAKRALLHDRSGLSITPLDYGDQPGMSTDERTVAHTLGLSVPGAEASTSFYPGYQWWPRPGDEGFMYGSGVVPPPLCRHPGHRRPG